MIWLDTIELDKLSDRFTLEILSACHDLTYNEIRDEVDKTIYNIRKLQEEKEKSNEN